MIPKFDSQGLMEKTYTVLSVFWVCSLIHYIYFVLYITTFWTIFPKNEIQIDDRSCNCMPTTKNQRLACV